MGREVERSTLFTDGGCVSDLDNLDDLGYPIHDSAPQESTDGLDRFGYPIPESTLPYEIYHDWEEHDWHESEWEVAKSILAASREPKKVVWW